MTDNEITITTDEQALGLVLERANIEIDELYEMGERNLAEESMQAYKTVKADLQEAKDGRNYPQQ